MTKNGEIVAMDIFGTAPSVDAGGYAIPRPLNEASKQVEIERALKVEEKTILANEADRDEDAKDTDDGKDCPIQASAEGPEYEYGTPQEEKKAIERLQGKDVPQGEDVPRAKGRLHCRQHAAQRHPHPLGSRRAPRLGGPRRRADRHGDQEQRQAAPPQVPGQRQVG